jgi:hypothetical protein
MAAFAGALEFVPRTHISSVPFSHLFFLFI